MRSILEGDALSFSGRWQYVNVNGVTTARISCPECGVSASLEETHKIQKNGNVIPSIDCPKCSFHDFVMLKNWIER